MFIIRLTSSQKMRDCDNAAIHFSGVPSTWLMTNASEHLAISAIKLMDINRSCHIFCGTGNNGGDGIAAALYLMRRGVKCRIILIGKTAKMTPDSIEMHRRLIELGGKIESFSELDKTELSDELKETGVIIDAIFGIGLTRDVSGEAGDAIELINSSGSKVLSADIPSGVSADTGAVLGTAVKADRTITFSMAKPGQFVEPGCSFCGELRICNIGIPKEYLEDAGTEVFAITKEYVSLPKREEISHKGDYGRLLIIGGSVGFSGAPSITAKASLRSGAGLVSIAVPSDIYEITAVKNDEAMPFPLPSKGGKIAFSALEELFKRIEKSDVCALGMGLGIGEEQEKLVCELISQSKKQLILDADALTAISKNMDILKKCAMPPVLTPHEGEFLRMGGKLTGDRIGDALAFSKEHNAIIVLKGHRTIIAFPDGELFINTKGNAGMAKGGTGDALAGVIAAYACQMELKKALISACYHHALAGDICAEKYGEYFFTATDLIDCLYLAQKS
ncbi:NAD(P)H-hydrate dehydratase [Clostridiaceae bacterium OttesenSCG-928-D20]|nr:NAD(P)H-hydrate dehydratase [Clostridiaceae bacterium OttesenSCG-928-D20]